MNQHEIEVRADPVDDLASERLGSLGATTMSRSEQRTSGRGRRARAASISASSSKRNARRPNGNASINKASGCSSAKAAKSADRRVVRSVSSIGRPASSTSTLNPASRSPDRRQLDRGVRPRCMPEREAALLPRPE